MTKLLDEAIAKVRELPEEEQECAAEIAHGFRGVREAGRLQALGGGACCMGIVYSEGTPEATVYLKCYVATRNRCR